MKTEYFNKQEFKTENLMEPWKETFTRGEVERSIKDFADRFVANTNTAYMQKNINDWIKENL